MIPIHPRLTGAPGTWSVIWYRMAFSQSCSVGSVNGGLTRPGHRKSYGKWNIYRWFSQRTKPLKFMVGIFHGELLVTTGW
jgi:hypothetical protein